MRIVGVTFWRRKNHAKEFKNWRSQTFTQKTKNWSWIFKPKTFVNFHKLKSMKLLLISRGQTTIILPISLTSSEKFLGKSSNLFFVFLPVWPNWAIFESPNLVLEHTFSYKSSQNIWLLLGHFEKHHFLEKTTFWAPFGKLGCLFIPTSGHTDSSHRLWTCRSEF